MSVQRILDPADVRPQRSNSAIVPPESEGFRKFVVDNPDFIELPNCTAIEAVKMGGHDLEQVTVHYMPQDSTLQTLKPLNIYNWALDTSGGKPVLLRGLNSNDGKWQVGAEVFVKGEWSDDKGKKSDGDNPDAELMKLDHRELVARAQAINPETRGNASRTDLVKIISDDAKVKADTAKETVSGEAQQ